MDVAAPRSRDVALAALRRHRPAAVVARLSDGAERKVTLGRGRGRWERAAAVVAPWVDDGAQIELRDGEGGVLAVVEAELDQDEAGIAVQGAREERLLGLLIKGQEVALKHHRENVGVALDAFARVVESLSVRLGALEASYGKLLRAQYEAITLRAEAEAAETPSPLDALAGAVIGQRFGLAGVSGAAEPPTVAVAKEAARGANGPRGSKRGR